MYRAGQWLMFSPVDPQVDALLEAAGAHAHEGKFVGIYCRAATDVTGESTPECVRPCSPNGENVVMFDGTKAVNCFLTMDLIKDVEECYSRDQLPPDRTFHPDFVPHSDARHKANLAKARAEDLARQAAEREAAAQEPADKE